MKKAAASSGTRRAARDDGASPSERTLPTCWSTTDWYIDSKNGSDSNTGDETAPIKTFCEVARRLHAHPLSTNLTVHVAQRAPSRWSRLLDFLRFDLRLVNGSSAFAFRVRRWILWLRWRGR